MLSNNVIIPYGWIDTFKKKTETFNNKNIVNIRKVSIFSLIIIAFVFYKYLILESSLFSVGMVSFVLIAQLAPSFFGAIFWRRGTYSGALIGLIVGIAICYINLIIPQYTKAIHPGLAFHQYKILEVFRISYLETIPQVFFWSLLANSFIFAVVSVSSKGNYRERNYAEIYVDIDKYIQNHEDAYIWRGKANVSDIRKILVRFLGDKKTKQALKIFNLKYNIDDENDTADSRFIKFSENLLSGRIGTASSKILIEGVTKEDKISLPEVLKILEESKENITLNRKLKEQSRQLRRLSDDLQIANYSLIEKDKQKDDFLDSVTHELRTPITAIRAAGEILLDDDDIPPDLKKEFLSNIISESDRLNELINDILYLDKLETGTIKLNIEENNILETYQKALKPILHLIQQKNIHLSEIDLLKEKYYNYDEARIIQVFQNILGNAYKFTDEGGMIQTKFQEKDNQLKISIFNTGKKIPQEDLELIFDKFYQSKNQNIRKPEGTGLGLAICRKILDAHKGKIYAENKEIGVTITMIMNQEKNGDV